MQSKEYKVDVDSRCISIWDTAGLDQSEMDRGSSVPAIEQAWHLITRLREVGGIHLLIFCIRGRKFTVTTLNIYRLFYEVLCGQQVPIAFVITHLEREVYMEDWWTRNEKGIENFGLRCVGHACVTGIPDRRGPDGKYERSRSAILGLLRQHDETGRYIMPEEDWPARLTRSLKLFKKEEAGITKEKKLKKALIERCGLGPEIAHHIMVLMMERKR
ncbi:hypothetical protein ID866_10636 [Astraeus odoratus]|nr:hypothetical protein ID866_10636 [Astraeus odoratus]